MQANNDNRVVEGIARHMAMYLDATRKLTDILDQENQLLLFEDGEHAVLSNQPRQDAKHALYARVETLARIVTRTLQIGTAEDVAMVRVALEPVESFRRSLRLNSALLEVAIERQERRMQRILRVIERSASEPVTVSRLHVADHSL